MEKSKLDRIVQERTICTMENRPAGCWQEYYTMFEDEDEIYYLSEVSLHGGRSTTFHNGYYISTMPFEVWNDVMATWQYIVINSKEYTTQVTQKEIDRYNFGGQYLKKLCGTDDVFGYIREQQKLLKSIFDKRILIYGQDGSDNTSGWCSVLDDGTKFWISNDDNDYGKPGVIFYQYESV